jgi:Flp pilus assembly CpaF family ATPase
VWGGLFEGEEAVLHVIEGIVAPLGLRIDESYPYVDARLPDGSRVQTNFPCTPFALGRSGAGPHSLGARTVRESCG